MNSNPDSYRKLLQLQKLEGNKFCFECSSPNTQWASSNLGIFICLDCAGIHRGLGVHISFVRSISMDQFKPDELLKMEKGGNNRLRNYFIENNIPFSLSPKEKYDNPKIQEYRNILSCEVEYGGIGIEPIKKKNSNDSKELFYNCETIDKNFDVDNDFN